MKKLSLLGIILSLFLVGFVFSQPVLELDITNPQNSNPGASVSSTFTITNSGDEAINDVFFSIPTALDGPSSYTIPTTAVSFSENYIDLDAGGDFAEITYTIAIPSQQYTGDYIGIINASSGAYAVWDDFILNVNQVVGVSLGSEIDSSNVFFMSGSDDSTITRSFTLTNTGNVDLTNMQITISEETQGSFSDGDKIVSLKVKANSGSYQTVTFGQPVNLGTMIVGANTITIEATLPNNINVDTYEGNVTLQSLTYPTTLTSFSLEVRVEPEICEEGRMSNGVLVSSASSGWIQVSIDEPDDGDDFKQGDEISVEANVKNEGTQDLDIVAEAILYDLDEDEEVTSITSDSIEIQEDEDEDFSLTLTIPYDENLDDNNNYMLYVKAYEEDQEDDNCNYDSIEMNFERESHEVIINSFTINPSVVNPGSLVSFVVNVLNVGEKQEDGVYIKLYNQELGLDQESAIFDLDEYDKTNNDETKTISFTIPITAQAKEYTIEAIVYFDDGDESNSAFGTLTVSGETSVITPITTPGVGTLTLPQTTISATAGKVFSIPYTISNTGTSAATYTIEIIPTGSWAESVIETVTVEAGSSKTEYAYLTPASNTASGSYSATVILKSNGNEIESKNLNVNVAKSSTGTTGAAVYQPSTLLNNLVGNMWFWILGNIILVVLVLAILLLIFRKK